MTTYRIVELTADGWIKHETTDLVSWAIGRGVEFNGTNQNRRQRIELHDQPILKGFLGPMWDGDAIRYENQQAYGRLSA